MRNLVAVAITAGLALLVAAPAGATYPGEPGLLTWSTSAGFHDGSSSIWGRDVFGGGLTHLTNHKDTAPNGEIDPGRTYVSDTEPSWAPDGKRFAFVRERGFGPPRLYVARADGSHAHAVVGHDVFTVKPAFGRGGRIAFVRRIVNGDTYYDEIWSVRTDGTHLRQLTKGYGEDPDWSPNGRRIVFDNENVHGNGIRLSIMRADGSHEHVLDSHCGRAAQASFGPGGHRLAVLYAASDAERVGVYTIGLSCRHKRRVTSGGFGPVWSPDGQWIAYYGGPSGEQSGRVVRPDGTDNRRVAGHGGLDLDWQPRP